MAVPAHDPRDFEFAVKFGLPIECIMDPETDDPELKARVIRGEECWTEDGIYINSDNSDTGLNINNLSKEEGILKTIKWLDEKSLGSARINYKLRDWLFSRQRYWGEPFPVIHWEDGEITLLDESELPLELPPLEKFQPGENGESPLANSGDWLSVTDANGRTGRRETNTMPQWAGSCWYYLRYIDPGNDSQIFNPVLEKYWMPVDLYVGGAEHAVLHLLYSRFWHKVLYDLKIVSHDEPYQRLFNQGMILAFAYETATGSKVSGELVVEKDSKYFHRESGEELRQIVAKMSKSLKNVVNPDDVTKRYGADSLRLYEMFIGPLEASKPWDDKGVKGVFGFLGRTYRFFSDPENIFEGEENPEISRALHQMIKKVSSDIENLRFNTAISAMMIFTNLAIKVGRVSGETASDFILVLSPFAPHLAEEIWEILGSDTSLAYYKWPKWDEKWLEQDRFEYPVSFNGKMRFKLELPVDLDQNEVEKIVLDDPRSEKWIGTAKPKKIVLVPGRIINVVV